MSPFVSRSSATASRSRLALSGSFVQHVGVTPLSFPLLQKIAPVDVVAHDHREVIQLARIEKLPFREIAARMHRSPGAVKLLLLRALRELKQRFGETESLHLPDRSLKCEGGNDG